MEIPHNPQAIDAFQCECVDCKIKQWKISRHFNLNPTKPASYHYKRQGPLGIDEHHTIDGDLLGGAY